MIVCDRLSSELEPTEIAWWKGPSTGLQRRPMGTVTPPNLRSDRRSVHGGDQVAPDRPPRWCTSVTGLQHARCFAPPTPQRGTGSPGPRTGTVVCAARRSTSVARSTFLPKSSDGRPTAQRQQVDVFGVWRVTARRFRAPEANSFGQG